MSPRLIASLLVLAAAPAGAATPSAWCDALFPVEDIGASAVHFRQPDLLSERRMEFNLSFALGDRVVELRYFSVDDAKLNKFIQASSELEAIARRIAERGLP